MPVTAALGAVLVYRILSLGGVVVIGWTVLAVQRLRPGTAQEHTAPAGTDRDLSPARRNPMPNSLFRAPRITATANRRPRRVPC